MNWREVFAPDNRKLAVFFIIILLANLPGIGFQGEPFYTKCGGKCYNGGPSGTEMIVSGAFYPLVKMAVDHQIPSGAPFPIWGIAQAIVSWFSWRPEMAMFVFAMLVLNIILWYAVACMLLGIDWKSFLAPTPAKIILFLVLMASVNYSAASGSYVRAGFMEMGVPFKFYASSPKMTEMMPDNYIGGYDSIPDTQFSFLAFAADLAFWYVAACLFLEIWEKLKTENPKLKN